MAIWLFKTEPSAYSFDRLERDKRTSWDGVKNPQALQNLAKVKKNDEILIYHTGDEKAVVGVATALGNAFSDPKESNPKLLTIEIASKTRLTRPVTLAEIKANPAFEGWDLVRLPRLSVMAVSEGQWAAVEKVAKQTKD